MVFYYVLIVSLLLSFCQLVSGTVNNTTAASPVTTADDNTTTGERASEPITSVPSHPIVTAEATTKPCGTEASFTRMTATFETENSECNQGTQEKFEEKTWDLYEGDGLEAENVNVMYSKQTGKCIFDITVVFRRHFSTEGFIETFKNAIKQSEFKGMEISESYRQTDRLQRFYLKLCTSLYIGVDEDCVILGEYLATEAECKKICCEGPGGEITLTRECTSNPANKCVYYKLTKVEKNCMNVCEKHCSGAITNISLMAMLLGAFIHWLLK